jgi:hypothetical protein
MDATMPISKRKAQPASKPVPEEEKKAKKILQKYRYGKPLTEAEERFILRRYADKHKPGRRPDMLDELKRRYGKLK